MAKKELTISEFRSIIREEAIKLKRRIVLENEKKALQEELKSLLGEGYTEECAYEEGTMEEVAMEEGLFGGPKAYRKKFLNFYEKNKQKYGLKQPTEEELNALVQQMVDDKGQGFPTRDKEGNVRYKPSAKVSPHGAGAGLASWQGE